MSVKTKTILSLICNSVILLTVTCVIASYLIFGNELLDHGYQSFLFFTTDANTLGGIAAGLVIICDIKILQGKRETVARPFTLIKYAGVVSLMLTFFVVLCMLIPIYGIGMQWGGRGFFNHLWTPVLSFVSFVFFDMHTKLKMRDTLFGLLPTLIYGAVYFMQVVVLRNWIDFYAFNSGGLWFVIMPCVIGGAFLMCLFVRFLRNRMTG